MKPLRTFMARSSAAVLLSALSGCSSVNGFYTSCPSGMVECSDPGGENQVAVVFLAGDAGYAPFDRNPVLQHMRDAVAALDRRGVPVTVVYLGDNVYEEGLRDGHPEDLQRLEAQIRVVEGTAARAIFVPGNHDWAERGDAEGLARVRNQWNAIEAFDRSPLVAAEMVPEPGCPGPVSLPIHADGGVPVGRILAIDSQWWVAGSTSADTCPAASRDEAREVMRSLIRSSRGDELVVVASHHPLLTGGPHGGNHGWSRLAHSLRLLGQDLNDSSYRSFIEDMRVSLSGAPGLLVYAAGHDHSLQVMEGVPDSAAVHVVSGSASRLTSVDPDVPGVLFSASVPGYMRLDVRSEGSVRLNVVAGCVPTDAEGGVRADHPVPMCRTDEGRTIRTIFSKRLR